MGARCLLTTENFDEKGLIFYDLFAYIDNPFPWGFHPCPIPPQALSAIGQSNVIQ